MWKVVIARGGIHWGCGCIREVGTEGIGGEYSVGDNGKERYIPGRSGID